jgi:glycosyltransferase involved in cell wall biosynthesis
VAIPYRRRRSADCVLELTLELSLALAVALCVGWALVLVRVFRTTKAFRRLPTATPDLNRPPPKVSVVVAARDEASTIEPALRSLLAQEGVDLELIVVDDMSSDGTADVVKKLVAEVGEKRLLLLQQKKLPPGWIAKCYAVELGQGRASGDWILFTDADVLHGRRAIFNAVATMERERLDHLAVFPRLEAGSFVEALVLPLFVLLYQLRLVDPRAAEPDSGVGAGVGAFNLVRADSYRLRGTHARIRGSILDDSALGTMMRDEGGRGSVMKAVGQVRHRPYRSMREIYFGVQKSVLPQFGHSSVLAVAAAGALLLAAFGPVTLVLAGLPMWASGRAPWLVLPAALAALFPLIGLFRARQMVRFEPLAIVMFPVAALIMAVAAVHAAAIFATKGTIEWRGRTYTRKDLAG